MSHEEWTQLFVESLRKLWLAQEVDIFTDEIQIKIKITSPHRDELFAQINAFCRIHKGFTKGLVAAIDSEPVYTRIDTAIFSILSSLTPVDTVIQEEHETQENFQRSVKEYTKLPRRQY